MINHYQQLSNLHYQYICSIYCKLLCLQYLQNLSSVFCHPSSVIADYPTLSDETFTYDALGNRKTDSNTGITEWLYNQNNQLLNSVNNQFTYDANGSQIEEKDVSGQLEKQYLYNTENRLAEIKDGSGVNIATYYYDPFGRRLSKTITNPDTTTTKTYFHYNDEGYSAEKTGNQITSYLFSLQNTWSTSPILKRENNTYYYYQNDHLGMPNILHDKQGQVVNARETKAFGERENSVNSISNEFAFAGQYNDVETNTYYNFHRDYHPNLGRYIKSDPIGLGGGLNMFNYVIANPIINIDEKGLNCKYGGVCPIPKPEPPGTCGSGWNEPIIPDNPLGFTFESCCREHDDCYPICGIEKSKCDDDFRDCMRNQCKIYKIWPFVLLTWGSAILCDSLAEIYYEFTDKAGGGAYDDAQEGCCEE